MSDLNSNNKKKNETQVPKSFFYNKKCGLAIPIAYVPNPTGNKTNVYECKECKEHEKRNKLNKK